LAGLANYSQVIRDSRFGKILQNTALLLSASATLVTLVALAVSWLSVRSRVRQARLLESLAFAPQAFPAIIIALATLLTFIASPLYGTVWIIVMAYLPRYLPFSTRLFSSALMQIHRELEEAAMVQGASTASTIRRVVVPLVLPALINGWLWVATHVVRDLTFPLFLVSGTNTVISMLLWEYWDYGQSSQASAVAVLLVAIVIALVVPARWYANRTRHETVSGKA